MRQVASHGLEARAQATNRKAQDRIGAEAKAIAFGGLCSPGNVDLPETINLLIMAVIGGLARIEGAWVGAFVFVLMQSYITDSVKVPLLGFGGTLFGGKFPTLVGIIFLVIVLVSPGGLMGIWDRAFELRGRLGRWRSVEPRPTSPTG